MRLSFGLEARQVQVQKLAPRMIQSMEILQLPIMALQERIEQEMNENPLLEVQELDPTLPEEPAERDNPDAPADTEREFVVDETKDNVDDFERLLNLDKEVPDHFDDGPRRSLTRIEEDVGSQARCHGQRGVAPRIAATTTCMHQIGELELDPESGADGRTDHFGSGRQRRRLSEGQPGGSACRRMPTPSSWSWHARRWRSCRVWIRRGSPLAICANACCCSCTPDMPYYDELKTLISGHLEDLRDNRLPQIERKTGYSHRADSGGLGTAAQAEPQTGRHVCRVDCPHGDARRDVGTSGGWLVPSGAGGHAHAAVVHQRLLPQATDERPGDRRRRRSSSSAS